MQIELYLREERERLGLTQTAMSRAAGVAFRTYCDYESGKSEPKASTLAELSAFGVDVLYVLTGRRTPDVGDISEEEIEVIKHYRIAPLAVKKAVSAALTAGSAPEPSTVINVSGSGQRFAGRDYHENKK
ncbi:transcriptional regulator [Serratia sp. S1B]|nr:transcriptional regulator [Serratia sp. S1B]